MCCRAKYLSYFYNMSLKLQQLDLFGNPIQEVSGVKEKKKAKTKAIPEPVSIVETPVPAAPTAAAQSFCGSATVADLEATGTNLVWSLTEGGDALEATAALATGTYYVTQTIDG